MATFSAIYMEAMVPNECNSPNSRSKEKTMTDRWRATTADQTE